MNNQMPERFRLYAPWERVTDRVLTPLEAFLHTQTASAMALLSMTIVALILANSPIGAGYHHLFEQKLTLALGEWQVSMSLHHWINDGLMAFFFFLIGLEIKRELLVGELSDLKAAMLPVMAAIGGMVMPALIYVAINWGEPTINGWGIPMATDIAFAIATLMLLSRWVPAALVTFLVALAIVDDLGVVAVIAIFYTDTIVLDALLASIAVLGILWMFNLMGIYRAWPYALGGVVMWSFMLASGVHATIAGVLTALAIPARPKIRPQAFDELLDGFLTKFRQTPKYEAPVLDETQKGIIRTVGSVVRDVQPPSMRLEHALHLPVALMVIPLFALANAGIHINGEALVSAFQHPVSLGIILGLVLGKMLGIAGFAWLAVKLGMATLPSGARMHQLVGIGFLGGIGFTMSIFVAELSWPGHPELLQQAKMGILMASLLAGISGYVWLRWVGRTK